MTDLLQIISLFGVALLIGWLAAEFKAKLHVRVAVGMVVFVCVGYAGYLSGHLQAAMRWSWVPKEHNHLGATMERFQELLGNGNTGAVVDAVAAYNQTLKTSTNEFGYYQASSAMWDALNKGK